MSDGDKSHMSVLLPEARVALFTTDAESKESFQALEKDWRFARVSLTVIDGDVEMAIKHYSSSQSPELVIIQTEEIDDGFTDKLESLAGHLSEKTSAIVIGPVNDVNLYRKLIGMGVSDYLVRPIKTAAFSDDIAATLIESVGSGDSRLIAVMGAKGGVGATVISEALAWHISSDLGQKTFFLDAAAGWSTLSVGMNFEPSTTLAEAVRAAAEGNEDSLTRMIANPEEKLFILSSGGDVMLDDHIEPEKFEALLKYLMGLYPVVIVDLSGGTAALKRAVLTRAHLTYLVSAPTLPSVRAARTLLHEIGDLRGGNNDGLNVILNMHGYAPKFEVPKKQIEEGLERPLSIVIPFDPVSFVQTESEAGKLGASKNGSEIVKNLLGPVKALLSISANAAGSSEEKNDGIGRFFTKRKTKS
ncbi:MAG: type II secretion protein ATPase [Alphaproteobacteria bacterium CG_4_9_14_3_um_filter_47_13]|nr:MAG: type II secretion protein ATPase [Alphaproteobacteria bacterium CG_4_9_14_3_um_filter_47_13]